MSVHNTEKPDIFANINHEQELINQFRQSCINMGYYGQSFLNYFDKTECKVVFSAITPKYGDSEGVYYAHDEYGKYTNHLEIPPASYMNIRDVHELLFHEGIHAIQSHHAAATMARTKAALCPLSSLKLMFAMEIDATVKTTAFMYLYDIQHSHPDIYNQSNTPEYLKDQIQQDAYKRLFFAFTEAKITPKAMRKQYVNRHLSTYEKYLDYYLQNNTVYYELDDFDLWEIGNSMGIPTFGDTADNIHFMRRMIMEDADWDRLDALNNTLGITQDNTIRFSDYLSSQGLDRQTFLRKQHQDLP